LNLETLSEIKSVLSVLVFVGYEVSYDFWYL